MANLLVVDWDYFFARPELCAPSTGDHDVDALRWAFDWGHAETGFMVNGIWMFRAGDLLRSLGELPGSNGKWRTFWDRFTIDPAASVHVSDSNLFSGLERPVSGGPFEKVSVYDAHHDSGFNGETLAEFVRGGVLSCENWTLAHVTLGTEPSNVHVRYPPWRAYALELEPAPGVPVDRAVDDELPLTGVVFDAVSVCRSGAWVPPWLDQEFVDFLDLNPTGTWEQVCKSEGFPVRDFDLASAQHLASLYATAAYAQQRVSERAT
ncbi:MAG: hypothetical protein ACOH1Y_11785 [Propionicimonas sp.]